MNKSKILLIFLLGLSSTLTVTATVAAQESLFTYRGELSQPSQSPEDSWFKEVELADVDEDGGLDIVLTQKQPCPQTPSCNPTSGSNIDHLYLNPSGQALALLPPSTFFSFRPTVGTFPLVDTTRNYDIEIADFDLDGHLDIVRPDRGGEVVVLWGAGDGTFLEFTDVLADGNPNEGCAADGNYDDIDVADLDGDGDLDFVVAQYDSCGRNFMLENLKFDLPINDPRSFEVRGVNPDELPASNTHSVSFGDVNQDDEMDILLANTFFGSTKPELFLGSGYPFDFLPVPIELDSPGVFGFSPTTVADLRDLNGDGRLDVYFAQGVFSPPNNPRHGVYFHSGNNADPFPTFTPWPESSPFSEALYDARYGDLDDDGNQEIISVNINIDEPGNRVDTELHIASVVGNQLVDVADQFLPSQLFGGIAVALGDLDNDGDEDMVLGGISNDPGGIYSAAHVYENRTYTHLQNATVLNGTFLALKEFKADTNLTIPQNGNVTFEAGTTIILGDGFTATAGSEFVARNL